MGNADYRRRERGAEGVFFYRRVVKLSVTIDLMVASMSSASSSSERELDVGSARWGSGMR